MQRHAAGGAFAVEAGALGIASSGGKPLPDAVRGKMENALGADFSGVRVHVGPQAERIGAIAFTTGNDIYFAPGRYQPETIQGQQLLGHELAHVVQQRQGRVRNPLGSGLAVVQDRVLETEADRLGRQAAAYRVAVQAKMGPLSAPLTIQQARRGWRLVNDDELESRTGLRLEWPSARRTRSERPEGTFTVTYANPQQQPFEVPVVPPEGTFTVTYAAPPQQQPFEVTVVPKSPEEEYQEALKKWKELEKNYLTTAFGSTTRLNPAQKSRYTTEFLSQHPQPQKPQTGEVRKQPSKKPSSQPAPRSLDLPEGMESSVKSSSRAPTQPVPVDPQDLAKGIQSTAYNALPDGVRSALRLIAEGDQNIRNRPPFNNWGTPLPERANPTGYYKEVDAIMPNAPGQRQTASGTTRSSLRFVIGRGGEVYYTSNHYAGFTRVANVPWVNGAPGVW